MEGRSSSGGAPDAEGSCIGSFESVAGRGGGLASLGSLVCSARCVRPLARKSAEAGAGGGSGGGRLTGLRSVDEEEAVVLPSVLSLCPELWGCSCANLFSSVST